VRPSVAIVSTLLNPTAPDFAGGTEVSTYYVAQELARRGSDVRLYASGDSTPGPSLVPLLERSVLRPPPDPSVDGVAYARERTIEEFAALTGLVESLAGEDRVVHFLLVNFLPVYLAVRRGLPTVLTLQMPADNVHYRLLRQLLTPPELARAHPVALSHRQAATFPEGVFRVIPHGVELADFPFSEDADETLAWIGRMTAKKGCAEALAIAAEARVPLRIGGAPQTSRETAYFQAEVEPRLRSGIRYAGAVSRAERAAFYRARALIFPLRWDEPFGLTMAEAMACGTPVIAYDRGAVREVVEDGVTGFVCPPRDRAAMVAAVERIMTMPAAAYRAMRRACRRRVEARFTIAHTVDAYEEVYAAVAGSRDTVGHA
jgi:glycosyltransferase involved in cell wall biosynthesis